MPTFLRTALILLSSKWYGPLTNTVETRKEVSFCSLKDYSYIMGGIGVNFTQWSRQNDILIIHCFTYYRYTIEIQQCCNRSMEKVDDIDYTKFLSSGILAVLRLNSWCRAMKSVFPKCYDNCIILQIFVNPIKLNDSFEAWLNHSSLKMWNSFHFNRSNSVMIKNCCSYLDHSCYDERCNSYRSSNQVH